MIKMTIFSAAPHAALRDALRRIRNLVGSLPVWRRRGVRLVGV
jgi:hypothetical protein